MVRAPRIAVRADLAGCDKVKAKMIYEGICAKMMSNELHMLELTGLG